jgi:hypothetical protein
MKADDAFEFRNYLRDRGIIFSYSGYMTEEVLAGIGGALRTKMELDGTDRKIARTIFSIFVEQVQNVIRYSAELEEGQVDNDDIEIRYGVLTVGVLDGKHFVSCGNLINNENVPRLESSLKKIKDLDKDGLKTLYKETLRGEVPEGSKGAGVGFIDIARRATQGFDFEFSEIGNGYSYFLLNAYI